MKVTSRTFPNVLSILLMTMLIVSMVTLPGAQPTQAEERHSAQPQVSTGTAFTYQGQLKSGGSPANGQYDFIFTLYDALTGGNQVGAAVNLTSQTVAEGLFTVQLDFGANVFQGQARWLEIAVRQAGGGTYTTLSPRQPLTGAPYAQSLMPGAAVSGNLFGPVLTITNTSLNANSIGVYATGSTYGVYGNSTGTGVVGYSPSFGTGVFGQSGGNGDGVYGVSGSGNGVYGFSNTGHGGYFVTNGSANHYGVWGQSNQTGGIGVFGTSPGSGVYGYSASGTGTGTVGYSDGVANGQGVYGLATGSNGLGVHGAANNGLGAVGVEGESTSGAGVYGSGYDGVVGLGTNRGVDGQSATGNGVYGHTSGGLGYAGVYGIDFGSDGAGVYGTANGGPNAVGIRGQSSAGYAGYFDGTVHVEGTFSASAKNFKIDDPLDPANKYLYHTSVESPDMMDIYNGNVTTDASGEAIVQLPGYFEALNEDFRYQLTIMGDQFAQARVSSKITNNRFTIKTDKPNIEISWQVTGIRHDPYAENNRTRVEEDKTGEDKGKYLYPEGYGQPESKKINPWPEQDPAKDHVPQP